MHIYSTNGKSYDVHELWKIAPKSKRVKVSLLTKQLRQRCWGNDHPTPIRTLRERKDTHWHNIMSCDLRYPIILAPNNQIADGIHRLYKAVLLNKRYIMCKQFSSWNKMSKARIITSNKILDMSS